MVVQFKLYIERCFINKLKRKAETNKIDSLVAIDQHVL